MLPIIKLAENLGLSEKNIERYGDWTAKVNLDFFQQSRNRRGKLILVTAMTPTPHGEGKTVTSIGLAMSLQRLGHSSIACIRQPSMGPVFGIKGGATGGGKATVEPSDGINMGFTGDIDRVAEAHNLLAAMVDNHLFHGNDIGIDPARITWPRTLDMEDRALRQVVTGLGQKAGAVRETSFIITAASEIMAVLSLSRSYPELKERLSRILVGYTHEGRPVQAGQLGATGAMAAILRDAFKPNLVQTSEGTPALVHGGCFGNIAHGTASLVSILLGLQLADYCVVEAGFGSDLGAEKFVDIAARTGGLNVNAAVVVATVRALRHHGSMETDNSESPSLQAVKKGLENLEKHVENIKTLGLTPIVAINRFPSDSEAELSLVGDFCDEGDIPWALSNVFQEGGKGALELSQRVLDYSGKDLAAKPLYPLNASIEEKLDIIVRRMYGGAGADYTHDARRNMKQILELEHSTVPACVAKTPLSLSDDQSRLGRPQGFRTTVRRVVPAMGAGFNIAYMGDILTMPGLPKHPSAELIELTDDGRVKGLS